MKGEEKKSKRDRRNKTICKGDEKSELSALPDDLLCHIISFLQTKYAVQTSVLSQRFRNLWYRVPVLDLNCNAFQKLSSFDKFVNRVLAVRDSTEIKTFSFIRRCFVPEKLFNKVVNYAVAHNVEVLNLGISVYSRYSGLQNPLYSSETIKAFLLRSNGFTTKIEKPFCFRKLTMIDLDHIIVTEPDLFSSCPELVNVTLTNCELGHSNALSIVAPKLTKLILYLRVPFNAKVMLSTPKLGSFYYKGTHPLSLSTSELAYLDDVGIDFNAEYMTNEEEKQVPSNLISMLHTFGKAKTVTLSLGAIKVLTRFCSLLELESSPFQDLTSFRFLASKRNNPATVPLIRRPFFKIALQGQR